MEGEDQMRYQPLYTPCPYCQEPLFDIESLDECDFCGEVLKPEDIEED
jgi:hypothetical protein